MPHFSESCKWNLIRGSRFSADGSEVPPTPPAVPRKQSSTSAGFSPSGATEHAGRTRFGRSKECSHEQWPWPTLGGFGRDTNVRWARRRPGRTRAFPKGPPASIARRRDRRPTARSRPEFGIVSRRPRSAVYAFYRFRTSAQALPAGAEPARALIGRGQRTAPIHSIPLVLCNQQANPYFCAG